MRSWARLLLVIAAVVLVNPIAPVYAQCTSNASSCVSCHETQGLRPVLQSAQPWHVHHGFGDLCAACHGGDAAATPKAQAHVGLRKPLADPALSCAGCHARDAVARAEQYASAAARLAPAAPSPAPSATTSSATSSGASATASGASAATPPAAPSIDSPWKATADRVLTVLAVVLALGLYFALRSARTTARRPITAWLRDKTWNPYATGVLLGLVVAFSEVVCGRPLAASGAFDKLAAYPGRWLFPHSQYYRYIMAPGITWQVWLVVGVLAGAFASSKLSGEARARWLPDTQWLPRFGASRALRLAIAFVGAVLVQLGAGIAGGCTSGLAISGGAALAPAAFLFMAGMFTGGIPTAWLWYRGRPG